MRRDTHTDTDYFLTGLQEVKVYTKRFLEWATALQFGINIDGDLLYQASFSGVSARSILVNTRENLSTHLESLIGILTHKLSLQKYKRNCS